MRQDAGDAPLYITPQGVLVSAFVVDFRELMSSRLRVYALLRSLCALSVSGFAAGFSQGRMDCGTGRRGNCAVGMNRERRYPVDLRLQP